MFDLVPTIEAHAQEHPLSSKRVPLYAPAGSTVAQIVAAADLDPRHGLPIVILKRGLQATVLPIDAWGRVKPKPGTQVLIHYEVEAAAGALLASLVSAAAPTIAGSLFGLTVGTFGFNLAVAAITVVGGLIVNALIPPPAQARPGTQDPAQNVITGTQNRPDPYGAVPKVLGRHRIFPKRGAKGYTVTTDEGEIEFRGRYILGWGPVCISDLRIGTTAIQDFEDIEVEFLNVDETETLARQPALASITKAWRTGTQAMTLYPENVAEDGYAVELAQDTAVVRRTRTGTESADVDVTWLSGLFRQKVNEPSKRDTLTATFNFRFRAVGDADWTTAGTLSVTSSQNSQFRKTHKIVFPTPDEYDIEITQTSANVDQSNHFDTSTLTAIRSFRPGGLPSHDNVAEIAIRVRATDQLNGQIDTLNCIAHQMCRTWDGSAWTAPVVTRHPAWILANWLQGAHMKRTVPDARLDLAELRAWAVDESHWTCDLVVEGQTRVREIADIICPAGRAKFALTDLKYSVIREKPSEPIRQLITPRNSWGFKGRIVYPKTIHALRCVVKSERKNWQEDEVTVYNDGFTSSNATEFETIRLAGVVLTDDDTDQSNVYRLGRYHLADALLRYEQMSVNMDFEHLQVQRGDPVLVVHDVPSIGLGTARITSVSRNSSGLNLIRLDDTFPGASGNHRVVVRTQSGSPVEFTAAPSATGDTSSWVYVSGTVDALDLNEGDLVTLQKTIEGRFEALVTNIRRGQNDTAVVTFVPRATAVTEAADGTIPSYDPSVSDQPQNPETQIPAAPEVLGAVSSENTAIIDPSGNARPRILVRLAGRREVQQTASQVQLRYRPVGEQTFQVSERSPVGTLSLYTGPLEEGVAYEVDVSSLNRFERRSAWVSATASLVATSSPGKTPAKPGGVAASGRFQSNVVSWQAVVAYTDGTGIVGPVTYRIYRSLVNNPLTGQLVHTTTDLSWADSGLADNTLYFYWVTAVSLAGEESAKSTVASATTNFISAAQMVEDIRQQIGAGRQIPALTALPPLGDYNQGDYVAVGSKLYVKDGGVWATVVGNLVANEVKAAIGNFGGITVDLLAVTTNLAAINANLGSVTAGSINTVFNGVGLQVNIPGKPSSVYIYQNSASIYAAYFENVYTPPSATFAEAGAIKVRSNSGYTIEVDNYGDYVGEQACAFMQNSQDIGSGPRGGAVYLARNMANGNYGVQVLRGGYYDTSGDGYGPFTGSHECIIAKGQNPKPGDILVVKRAVITGVSDSLVEVEISSEPNQKNVFGVFTRVKDSWTSVAALIDREKTWKSLAPLERTPSGRKSRRKREVKYHTDPAQFQDDYDLIAVNGLGEGGVNVCGENGDIEPGDLIVTSSIPGKGMRGEDDAPISRLVAKAIGHATYRNKRQTKLMACVYLCS